LPEQAPSEKISTNVEALSLRQFNQLPVHLKNFIILPQPHNQNQPFASADILKHLLAALSHEKQKARSMVI
jgi:hypothetical protein